MATKIRLQRHGRKSYAFYSIVIADVRAPRDGKFIEKIGTYNPNTNPATVDLNFDAALAWVLKGAQPSDTVRNILSREGVYMKKHLLGGVAKGAFGEAEAEAKFEAWKNNKQSGLATLKAKQDEAKKAEAKARLEAEKKINEEKAKEMADLIYKVKGEGDTIGGTLTCVIKGCPIGLGQPVFGKLHAALGNAMLSINAVKGFAYGQGFDSMELRGSEQNDVFYNNGGRIETKTNYSGGIQGGISNGQDIYFRVAFKPVATVLMEQHTVNINGIDTTMKAKGRHDPCVLPRAVPIVEAMAAITVLDYYLIDRTTQL